MPSPSLPTACTKWLKQPGLDAVCITTPSALHLEPALAAIRAGKHLMIEKPIDSTVEGTDHILREAEKAGVRVGSIFQARFGDAARQVKAAIDGGRFGRMVLASCYVKWNRTADYYTGWKGKLSEDGGGVIINQAIHGVDLLQWFAGMPVGSVRLEHAARARIESEDTCVAALKFASGAFGTIEGTTAAMAGLVAAHRNLRRTRFGAPGRRRHRALGFPQSRSRKTRRSARCARVAAMGSGAAAPMNIKIEGHQRQIQDFIDGIREKRPFFIEGARRARPWRWCRLSMTRSQRQAREAENGGLTPQSFEEWRANGV